MEIVPNFLFPTLVWATLFNDRDTFNPPLVALARDLQARDPAGVAKTNVRGWQSQNSLQNIPAFDAMSQRILQACQRIAESQRFKPNHAFQLQAWMNVSPPGASNQIHYHPNCHFSGVYYV